MTSYLILALILFMCLMIFLAIKEDLTRTVTQIMPNTTPAPPGNTSPHTSSNDFVEIKTYEKVTEHTERRSNNKELFSEHLINRGGN